jgi:hypothetical protein
MGPPGSAGIKKWKERDISESVINAAWPKAPLL